VPALSVVEEVGDHEHPVGILFMKNMEIIAKGFLFPGKSALS
jgi:hypothetical protein